MPRLSQRHRTKEAFCGCAKLTAIAIPASVQSIGVGAFDKCTKLLDLFFLGNNPPASIGRTVLQNKTIVHAAWDGTYGVTAKGVALSTRSFDAPDGLSCVITGSGVLFPRAKLPYLCLLNGIPVLPNWSVAFGSKIAKVDKKGVLTVGKTASDQPVVIRAAITINGCPFAVHKTLYFTNGLYGTPAEIREDATVAYTNATTPRGFTATWRDQTLHVVATPAEAALFHAAAPDAHIALLEDAAWPIELPSGIVLRVSDTTIRIVLPNGSTVKADGFTSDAPIRGTLILP